jgi:hypothetical protein
MHFADETGTGTRGKNSNKSRERSNLIPALPATAF